MKKPYFLALETSTQTNRCAFLSVETGEIVPSELSPNQTPSEFFLPMLGALAHTHGISLESCVALGVTVGPGSFTGIRFGLSLAQGLAFALKIPVVPLSTLVVLAASNPHPDRPALTVWDARMGECYWGLTHEGHTQERLSRPSEILPPPGLTACVALGNGLKVYPDILKAWPIMAAYPEATPQVTDVAKLGLKAFQEGKGIPPEALMPNYLRAEVATPKDDRK